VKLQPLAAVKVTVASGASQAPNLNALRNTVAAMLERVQLVRSGEWPRVEVDVFVPLHDHVPASRMGRSMIGCC
jgi:hypothetical protein